MRRLQWLLVFADLFGFAGGDIQLSSHHQDAAVPGEVVRGTPPLTLAAFSPPCPSPLAGCLGDGGS